MKKPFQEVQEEIYAILRKQLHPSLTYHNLAHTQYVLEKAVEIAQHEDVSPHDVEMIKLAALFHDMGYIVAAKDHEEISCEMAREYLEAQGVGESEIDGISGMIMATKIPQNPQNTLERVLADADLEYLGTPLFDKISHQLFMELQVANPALTIHQWNRLQIQFLEAHKYHTHFCQTHQEPSKQEHLKMLKEKY